VSLLLAHLALLAPIALIELDNRPAKPFDWEVEGL
jgi:hypothetical protein